MNAYLTFDDALKDAVDLDISNPSNLIDHVMKIQTTVDLMHPIERERFLSRYVKEVKKRRKK